MLRRIGLLALSALALVCFGGAPLLAQQQTEPRIAFVVGNAGYGAGALPTALNDAGLVAEALRSIGFEIVEGADLSQTDLVRSLPRLPRQGRGKRTRYAGLRSISPATRCRSKAKTSCLAWTRGLRATATSRSRACACRTCCARSPTCPRGPR